jgi:cytochrome c oxidase assembly protein subunit 15
MNAIRTWLWIGVFMVLIQVIIGGITRLTGSGLSITEWDVIMGAVPPLNNQQWNEIFYKYKQFPQYNLINREMDLPGFKNIFWWEYIHRNWARLIGLVFIIPFIWFLIKRNLSKEGIKKLLIVFALGALQGLTGWIMVASGLIDKPWVSPYNLTLHLILALLVYAYLIWLALSLGKKYINSDHPTTNKSIKVVIVILFLQIIFGGFMAGTKAGLLYNTYPLMNGEIIPEGAFTSSLFFLEHAAAINFIHRTFAIIVALSVILFWIQNRKFSAPVVGILDDILLVLIVIQFFLGVYTILNGEGGIPIVLGVLHQLGAFVLMGVAVGILYFSKRRGIAVA